MRAIYGLTVSLLLLVSASQAGLVHRRFREVKESLVSPALPLELRKDQIPVTVIELQEPAASQTAAVLSVSEPETLSADIIAPQTEILKAALETADIAEDIAKAVEQDQQLRAVDAVVEAERRKDDEETIEQEIIPQTEVIEEEQNELHPILDDVEKLSRKEPKVEQPQQETIVPVNDLIILHPEAEQPAVVALPVAIVSEEKIQLVQPVENVQPLKALLPSEESVGVEEQPQQVADSVPTVVEETQPAEGALPSVRQATQATPTQTTTQQNFVQQFIQPIGQFISQFTGGQNQLQQPQPGQVAADEPAAPTPTLPGFLNPSNAITQAQQAVQSVVNSTSQAFQGLQQFASSLGTQFQSTLSNLGGQQNQLTTSDSTTTRPPGPFQAIVSNFVGGNNNQGAQPATSAPGGQQQQQGPLQGIISFLQGGNRPQGGIIAAAAPAPVTAAPPAAAIEPVKDVVVPVDAIVDDKIGTESQEPEQESDSTNEVRTSEEVDVQEDSFEESQPEELIVVNDDANQEEVIA